MIIEFLLRWGYYEAVQLLFGLQDIINKHGRKGPVCAYLKYALTLNFYMILNFVFLL